jgi:hypothetical protein
VAIRGQRNNNPKEGKCGKESGKESGGGPRDSKKLAWERVSALGIQQSSNYAPTLAIDNPTLLVHFAAGRRSNSLFPLVFFWRSSPTVKLAPPATGIELDFLLGTKAARQALPLRSASLHIDTANGQVTAGVGGLTIHQVLSMAPIEHRVDIFNGGFSTAAFHRRALNSPFIYPAPLQAITHLRSAVNTNSAAIPTGQSSRII